MHATRFSALLLLSVFTTVACNDANDDEEPCKSTVEIEQATSTEANKLSVPGTIEDDESVLIRYTVNGTSQVATGEPAAGGKIVFGGIPTGTYEFDFVVSCTDANGDGQQDVIGSKTVIVN